MKVAIFSDDTELRDLVEQLEGYTVAYFSTELDLKKLPNNIELAIFDFDVVPLSLLDEWSQFPRLHLPKMAVVSAENLAEVDEVLDQLDNYIVRPLSFGRLSRKLNEIMDYGIRDTLPGFFSSEFNSPITSIRGTTELILRKMVSEDEAHNMLQMVEHSAKYLQESVHRLRDWLRFENSRNYDFQITSISDVLESSWIAYQLQNTPQKFKAFAPDDLPRFFSDKQKLIFVIVAILKNASSYSEDDTEIQLSCISEHGFILCSIRDNGIGIWDKESSQVFAKFERGIQPSAVSKYGLGLDLYLCKQIIEMHGGKIWFESELGVGTTFYFTLPLAE